MAAEARAPLFDQDGDQAPKGDRKIIVPFGADLVEYYNPIIVAGPDGSITGTTTWDGSPDGDNPSDKVD
jgi:hypothetical protein